MRRAAFVVIPLAAVAAGLVLLLSGASSKTARIDRSEAVSVADELAAPWPDLQTSAGNYPDFTDGHVPHGTGTGTRYGDSVLALGLLQRGLKRHDQRLENSAVRAFRYVVVGKRRRWLQRHKPSVFESMAVAAGYNLMRTRLPRSHVFRSYRRTMERWLLRVRPVSTILRIPSTSRFSNHYLVEAIEVFELKRTGLRSHNGRVLLGPGLSRAVRIYRGMINRVLPALARQVGQHRRGLSTFLISDPPDYPLAYQGLALGYYAQAVRMMGRAAHPAARAAIREAANASWLIAAPDGDLGWFGRSMEESWAEAGTALGAEMAADSRGASRGERLRFRGLRDAALVRLRKAYGNGPNGYHFIPALQIADPLGARALEPYAGSPSFAGVTLLFLNWTLDAMPAQRKPVGSLAAAHPYWAKLAHGQSTFAVARRSGTWFAVKQGRSMRRYPGDLRYDLGLVALKRRGPHGWSNVMPLRPLTYFNHATAGPILERGGVRGLPWAYRTKVKHGVVTLYGGWKRSGGGGWLRTGVRFRYAPTHCGVRFSFRAQRGDRIDYSSFVRSYRQTPTLTRRLLADSAQRITASPVPATLRVERRRYYSASDPSLRRARMGFRLRRSRTVSISVCAR